MSTHTRKHGTEVTTPDSGAERIAAIRRIVERQQYAKVDGCMIDLFSASAVVAVYDRLNSENQAKFCAMTAPKMAAVAFKLVK